MSTFTVEQCGSVPRLWHLIIDGEWADVFTQKRDAEIEGERITKRFNEQDHDFEATVKIQHDGHKFSYTVTSPDGKVAIRANGFLERATAVEQAIASMRDLEALQEAE